MADYRTQTDDSSTYGGWIVGAVIVLLILAGVWWVATTNVTPAVPNTGVPVPTQSTVDVNLNGADTVPPSAN